jgi:hypothetical protein
VRTADTDERLTHSALMQLPPAEAPVPPFVDETLSAAPAFVYALGRIDDGGTRGAATAEGETPELRRTSRWVSVRSSSAPQPWPGLSPAVDVRGALHRSTVASCSRVEGPDIAGKRANS